MYIIIYYLCKSTINYYQMTSSLSSIRYIYHVYSNILDRILKCHHMFQWRNDFPIM